jgi:prepilin-type N-terminal cleavage/methylation domain-containing protein
MLRKTRSFTLVELIIVVIIVGILASLGLTQYSALVEKSRLAEAKVRLGVMRNLAYEYYLNNGNMSAITNADVGVTNTCTSTDFYRYYIVDVAAASLNMIAFRCTSGGKAPNASTAYYYYMHYVPSTGESRWITSQQDGWTP